MKEKANARESRERREKREERRETEAGDAVVPLSELVAQHDPLAGRPVGPLVARLAGDRRLRQVDGRVRRTRCELLVRCAQKCCRTPAVRRCSQQCSDSYSLESIQNSRKTVRKLAFENANCRLQRIRQPKEDKSENREKNEGN